MFKNLVPTILLAILFDAKLLTSSLKFLLKSSSKSKKSLSSLSFKVKKFSFKKKFLSVKLTTE